MSAYSEIWRDIPDYEGKYQVSNLGQVRSLGAYYPIRGNGRQYRDGKLLTQFVMKNGYLCVSLSKHQWGRMRYVHRLVAQAFVENKYGYDEVNHKDEDKTNNQADNLEWCSHLYNINYGGTRKRISEARKRMGYGCIPIEQYDLQGNLIAKYKSASEAEESTGISSSSIRKVCLGRRRFKTAGGFVWKNAD